MDKEMLASDLIRELQAAVDACGDMMVVTEDTRGFRDVYFDENLKVLRVGFTPYQVGFFKPLSQPWKRK